MAEALGNEAAGIEEVNEAIRDQIELEQARARVSRAENREAMETVWDNQFENGSEIANQLRVDRYKGFSDTDQGNMFAEMLTIDFNEASMREL